MNGLLSSKSETNSSTRLAMLCIIFVVLFQLAYVTVYTKEVANLPIEQVYLVASVLGLKGWQKLTENKSIEDKKNIS